MTDINQQCKLVYEILTQASSRAGSEELAKKSGDMAEEIRQYIDSGSPSEELSKIVMDIYHNYYPE